MLLAPLGIEQQISVCRPTQRHSFIGTVERFGRIRATEYPTTNPIVDVEPVATYALRELPLITWEELVVGRLLEYYGIGQIERRLAIGDASAMMGGTRLRTYVIDVEPHLIGIA